MEQKYFYVTPMTYPQSNDLIYEISINDIIALAQFVITLNLEGIFETEVLGYIDALRRYSLQNDNEFKKCYLQLTSDSSGEEFLYSVVSLYLWEKRFRENGISEDMIDRYNHWVETYKKQLAFNNQLYKDQQKSL